MKLTVLPTLVMLVYVVASIGGLTLYKSSDGLLSWRALVGLVFYGGGFLIWSLVILRIMPLSIAFPIAAGALIAGAQLSGWMFLKETLSATQLLGVALIVAGVVIISTVTQRHAGG